MQDKQQLELFKPPTPSAYMSLTGETVGVDEVGRGPLVGDVVASAVILPKGCQLSLKDSKKLTATKRELLAVQIREQAIAYSIAVATPAEIDELNILQATMLAMQRAIAQLQQADNTISYVYVDGNRCPSISLPCEAVVKGDDKIMEISAASILAKVYRDQQMLELHQQFPQYGFDQHKGYPTAKHLEVIKLYGLLPGYRKSFKPVKQLLSL
ncbi:MAG: ribonuclease HII [Thiomicrorhabdus sp.]|nr:MAG: ribonuclease HII [Thiomicrorhabdus sp.]